MQLTHDWDDRYRNDATAWEDQETAPATKNLVLQNLTPGQSVLELGCGRGVDSLWLAQSGYRVTACDISATAIGHARRRAEERFVAINFYVTDVLVDRSQLPRCGAVFERGMLHTFSTDDGRALFARTVADLVNPGQLWLSVAGAAATPAEANEAMRRTEARISLSQIAGAVEPYFDIESVTRTRYGFTETKTDFPAFASVFRRRA